MCIAVAAVAAIWLNLRPQLEPETKASHRPGLNHVVAEFLVDLESKDLEAVVDSAPPSYYHVREDATELLAKHGGAAVTQGDVRIDHEMAPDMANVDIISMETEQSARWTQSFVWADGAWHPLLGGATENGKPLPIE